MKMRMLFQSNSVLKTQVAAQHEEIQSLTNQLKISNQKTDSWSKKLSEALRLVAQAHKQRTIQGMANSNRCGDNAAVPIPAQTQPSGNLWPHAQGQEQAAQAVMHNTMVEKHRTSPGFSLDHAPAVAPPARHGSSISINVSGQTVYSEGAEIGRHASMAPGMAPVYTTEWGGAPLLVSSKRKAPTAGLLETPTANQQLLGWWQGAAGYDTAQSVVASGTGTGSIDLSEVKKTADNLDCLSPVTNTEYLQGISSTYGVAKSSSHNDHEISTDEFEWLL